MSLEDLFHGMVMPPRSDYGYVDGQQMMFVLSFPKHTKEGNMHAMRSMQRRAAPCPVQIVFSPSGLEDARQF